MPTTHHTVAISQVRSILLGARHRGLAVEPLLISAGIAPALLDAPLARVSQGQYAALIRVLRRHLRDELWGLLQQPLPPGSFGRCMRQLVACHTLGDALRQGFGFYHLLLHDFVPRLAVSQGSAQVQFMLRRAPDARLDYAVKAFMLLSFGAASWLVARRIPLVSVDYPEGHASTDTSRVYQVPVRSAQAHVGLSFDARWLELPVVQSPQSLREFLSGAPANLIVKYRDTSSATERIRQLLRKSLGGEMPSLEAVSELLAVSPQTLRRRLREEGRGFQQIKDETRRDAAIELLLQTSLPLPEIASRVGFSEASTFHRAFKQWAGVAPGEYRLSHGPG
ncbi:AraC family transcriptional regulator [Aquabacterium sp.]|uniref:AraC family transcriptional regulator n=1 Tax=Aquabacterium sp. TaxID=1872578 RepID=UPI002D18E411|nr:AraC family transcriptional regulator [Aquabacterium sp.]HSW09226.1 AraC family transcriptional regulator [Aquabacterium sp.]